MSENPAKPGAVISEPPQPPKGGERDRMYPKKTWRQAIAVLLLADRKRVSEERMTKLLRNGLLADLFGTPDTDVIDRAKFRAVLGLEPCKKAAAPEPPADLRPTYPACGVVFELTLDGDAVDPTLMPSRDGYGEGWKYTGVRLAGKITRRFKLDEVDYQPTYAAWLAAFGQRGRVPEGVWREPFKARYRPDGRGPIAVADASWQDPRGGARFPCVDGGGASDFGWTGDGFSDGWRGLVEVSGE